MALQIERQTRYGVPCRYWTLGVINIHPRSRTVQVVLDGYPGQAYRNGGAEPLDRAELALAWSAQLADGGRAGIYAAIKAQHPDWGAAQDA